MIRCESTRRKGRVKATFVVPLDRHVNPVAVVGDFNDWDPTANPLAPRHGALAASILVDSGRRYAFRYLAEDGEWFNDDAAHSYESNGMGEDNSILDLRAEPVIA